MTRFTTTALRSRSAIRDPLEEHRTATPLELFFDLVFVVAAGRAAAALHHELLAGHVADGLVGFCLIFFGVWWAWMGFTWFSSAHDSNDVCHRVLTFVQMTGALIFATGVTRFIEDRWLVVGVTGYVIMRIGLVLSWLRVARDHPEARPRAIRYVIGVTAVQVLWIAALAAPYEAVPWVFASLGVLELAVPWWAERAVDRPLFHAEHIEERFGLFTIIVLGEAILSAAAGFQTAVDAGGLTLDLFLVGAGGLVMAFAAWWLYFDHPGHLAPTPPRVFRWSYIHLLVFGGLAALGAGIHAAAEAVVAGHDPEHAIDQRAVAMAVAIPVAVYLVGLVAVMLTSLRPTLFGTVPKVIGAAVVVLTGSTAGVATTVVVGAVVMSALASMMVLSEPDRLNHLPDRARRHAVSSPTGVTRTDVSG